jgi:hypothetical protein
VLVQSPANADNATSENQFMGDFPVVSGKGALMVSGKGYHQRELYEDGEVPTLTAYDGDGQLLPDGIYRFQFISTPEGSGRSARQRDVLRGESAQALGNGSGIASQMSGTFEIVGGQIIFR